MVAPVSTCKEWFDTLESRFVAEGAKGVKATFQYNLPGAGGGDFWVTVDDGTMTKGEGNAPKADVTYTMDADQFVKMSNGDLDGTKAYMMRKLKVKGNLAVAQKLKKILPPAK